MLLLPFVMVALALLVALIVPPNLSHDAPTRVHARAWTAWLGAMALWLYAAWVLARRELLSRSSATGIYLRRLMVVAGAALLLCAVRIVVRATW